jgi:putative transposase
MDEAIRIAQFIRNKCLRLWMDGRSISANDLQIYCSQLAHDFAFVARLNSQARQAAADRAWAAIDRFYANCQAKRPGKKGYPCFQHDCRSVEYKVTGWKLDPDGRHLTFTDGCGIGRVKLIGTRDLATFPIDQIKRVRLLRRADGYYCQVVLQAERHVEHVPTGNVIGIDVGLAAYYTDSDNTEVANPRFIHDAEQRVTRLSKRMACKSVHHKMGKKAKHNHAARHRAAHNKYPARYPAQLSIAPPQPAGSSPRQSANWHKARRQVGRAYLTLQRQREDFARKQANALVSSHDLIALEDLVVRNLVKNRYLAKAISDVGWARFRAWVEYYGRLHYVPVIAVPPRYTSQRCSGCGGLVRKSLSMRTHICARCGLALGRDHNSALLIRDVGLATAIRQGLWDPSTRRVMSGTVGHTGT